MCYSWRDLADDEGDFEAVRGRMVALAVTSMAMAFMLLSGILYDSSQVSVEVGEAPARIFSSAPAPARSPTLYLGLLTSTGGIVAATSSSPNGLTAYIAALVLIFLTSAPQARSFLYFVKSALDFFGAFAAYKLRNHLSLCWLIPAPPQHLG